MTTIIQVLLGIVVLISGRKVFSDKPQERILPEARNSSIASMHSPCSRCGSLAEWSW